MKSRRAVTSIHVIASVGLLGSTAAMLLTAVWAARSSDPAFAHAAYTLMQAQAFAFGIPLSVVSLVSGIALGRGTRWGVLRYWWTAAKLVLLVLTIGCGALVIGPLLDQRLRGAGDAWALVAAVAANAAMLAAASIVSVFKPGGRVRQSRSRNSREGGEFLPV
jgi:hypothetical protein